MRPVSVLIVNNKSQIEIVGRLADEMHFLLFKDSKYGPQFVKDRAHLMSDQSDGRAVFNNANPAELR